MLRTKSGLPKHCTYQADRYGNRRVRFRRRGVSVYLTGIPWSEDFMRKYAAALEREDVNRTQVGASKAHIARLILGAVRVLLRLAGIPWAQRQHAEGATECSRTLPRRTRSSTAQRFTE